MREFKDVDAFARFLQDRVLPELPGAVHRGVEDAAATLVLATKEQLGHYLDGPEEGMPTAPLADRTIDDRVRQGYTPDDPGLRSGDMRESYGARVSHPALHVSASIGSDDVKAVVFELGRLSQSNYQPPRPELSIAAIRNEGLAVNLVGSSVSRVLAGRPLPNARPPGVWVLGREP